MGDTREQVLRVQVDGKMTLRIYGAKITSDAGAELRTYVKRWS